MPMDYLRKIEKAEFPLRVEAFNDINNVLVLQAAGLIEVELPTANGEGFAQSPRVAVVLRITPVGRVTLERQKDSPSPMEGH